MYRVRRLEMEMKDAAVKIEAGYRGMAARKEYRLRRRTKAATVIQAWGRGYKARSEYQKRRKSTITIQCAWRGRVARRAPIFVFRVIRRRVACAHPCCSPSLQHVMPLMRQAEFAPGRATLLRSKVPEMIVPLSTRCVPKRCRSQFSMARKNPLSLPLASTNTNKNNYPRFSIFMKSHQDSKP